ncbi:uncharacterized protein [Henckelia pumila]|uniref:uncharacterized protein isoform X1 n=1 Tax=Henckelia pumila TaxID=405737 RepID=UPI003C6E2A6B
MLLKHYPRLGVTSDGHGNYPLRLLAHKPSAFRNGTKFTFWEHCIYYCMFMFHIKTQALRDDSRIEIHESDGEDNVNGKAHGVPNLVLRLFHKLGRGITEFLKLARINISALVPTAGRYLARSFKFCCDSTTSSFKLWQDFESRVYLINQLDKRTRLHYKVTGLWDLSSIRNSGTSMYQRTSNLKIFGPWEIMLYPYCGPMDSAKCVLK